MGKVSSLRIGVIGVGHLGNFHLKQLRNIPNILISGLYDINNKRAILMSKNHNVHCFSSINNLLNSSDAVSIVTPTHTHYKISKQALEGGCHIFIEKPITDNLADARSLLKKAKQEKKIIQVGHIERFNPGFIALKKINPNPKFIEVHRLAPFNPRGNDVPVILDLMIHDLDIIISLLGNKVKDIRANGVSVISKSIDIANARLVFNNGCVVNLTASRISQKEMRKMRLFSQNSYITIDFKEKLIEEYRIYNNKNKLKKNYKVFEIGENNKKYIIYNKPLITKHDALKEELNHFIKSIDNNSNPETDGESATEALNIALKIQSKIDKQK
jgi:predicted dehydrogenase